MEITKEVELIKQVKLFVYNCISLNTMGFCNSEIEYNYKKVQLLYYKSGDLKSSTYKKLKLNSNEPLIVASTCPSVSGILFSQNVQTSSRCKDIAFSLYSILSDYFDINP